MYIYTRCEYFFSRFFLIAPPTLLKKKDDIIPYLVSTSGRQLLPAFLAATILTVKMASYLHFLTYINDRSVGGNEKKGEKKKIVPSTYNILAFFFVYSSQDISS